MKIVNFGSRHGFAPGIRQGRVSTAMDICRISASRVSQFRAVSRAAMMASRCSGVTLNDQMRVPGVSRRKRAGDNGASDSAMALATAIVSSVSLFRSASENVTRPSPKAYPTGARTATWMFAGSARWPGHSRVDHPNRYGGTRPRDGGDRLNGVARRWALPVAGSRLATRPGSHGTGDLTLIAQAAIDAGLAARVVRKPRRGG